MLKQVFNNGGGGGPFKFYKLYQYQFSTRAIATETFKSRTPAHRPTALCHPVPPSIELESCKI